MSQQIKIVHLSDLHLGSGYYVTEWGKRVVEMVNSLSPDLLVISGDLTAEGHVHEYEQVIDYLKLFQVQKRLVIPGNHDARNEGYGIFEEIFGTRYPFYETEGLSILGVDSSQPDIDDGHIGRSNYQLITRQLNDPSQVKILTMHHHLVPIPGTGRERHIPTDAGDVLKLCVEQNIKIVLSGHKHLPWVWHIENSWLITAGTATSKRLKGRGYPSFNILTFYNGSFLLTEVNVTTAEQRVKVSAPV